LCEKIDCVGRRRLICGRRRMWGRKRSVIKEERKMEKDKERLL
jgi:hypothetical protein